MKLSEVKEPGFYCRPDDADRYEILEVYENSSKDEEFRKNDPLLIDEWVYHHTDTDGNIKVYWTHGLVCRLYEYENVEVIKLDDKYKVEADEMWEDKPTYKEILNQLKEQMEKDIQRYEMDDGFCTNDFICDIRDYLRIIGEKL